MKSQHHHYMLRALDLAMKGKGKVHPNPCVGCVIVKNGKVVGEGLHRTYGGAHAEIEALKKAGSKARGATAYITLEPCTHWGKTPPCVPSLIKAKLRKIFVAAIDPNPVVSGRGVKALKSAGIQVQTGLERRSSQALNKAFWIWKTKNRPYIIFKMAMSLDGKSATTTGDSKWISHPQSRKLVHQLRAESDAVMVGATTAIHDNPTLTSHGQGRNPLRVVLDPHLNIPLRHHMVKNKRAKTLIVTGEKTSVSKAKILEKRGVQILRMSLKFGKFELIKILKYLSKINVSQVLLEGGGNTAWEFLSKKLVDEILLFVSPKILGGKNAVTPVEGAGWNRIHQAIPTGTLNVVRSGPDIILRARLR